MQTGTIGVTTENIFPIIKRFLYSEHEIFLRELVSNAVDATQKMKALAQAGEFKGELSDVTIRISLDKEARTLTISDRGIGMTSEEIDKYINQIAFSSANEFLDKYKDKIENIIGHFGLGFYSSFMVSEKVEIRTKSYKDGAQAVKWSCDGSPNFTLEEIEKETRGTDIVLFLDKDSDEFLEESKITDLLNKYCKFLPIPIGFGKEKEWVDGKYAETETDKIINDTNPAWKKKPVDLTEKDYNDFYKQLYPAGAEPMFNIHLNVDYPFNLTGILYFPRIKSNFDIQRNKIQLYSNQVFVTDSVEGIVPDFLTLLHGVIDSPDIPLNVSRSYLQGDSNVKKISGHISKKVADRLGEIFKNDREQFEKKWDDLKLFIAYGILSDEKFYDRAKDFTLLKNTDGKYYTLEEYNNLVKPNQTDKNNKVVYLYTHNPEEQYSLIDVAKSKGYDVLLMNGQLDSHFIQNIESKFTDVRFARVDSDIVDKIIPKAEEVKSSLTEDQISMLTPVFRSQTPEKDFYMVQFEPMSASDLPVTLTQSEFMRRMKDMSAYGGGMGYYGELPDSYNLVVNANHPLVTEVLNVVNSTLGSDLKEISAKMEPLENERKQLEEKNKEMKYEDIDQADKDKTEDLSKQIEALEKDKSAKLESFGKQNKLVKQMVDLAMLANGLLKGEALSKFVRRSVELIEK